MLQLSKKIPARRTTVQFNWAYKNAMQCTEEYLKIRRKSKNPMDKCDWCGRHFEIGEWFALAQPKAGQKGKKRNWALCHACADLMGAPDRPRPKRKESENEINTTRNRIDRWHD
jgi:hypothetical protein